MKVNFRDMIGSTAMGLTWVPPLYLDNKLMLEAIEHVELQAFLGDIEPTSLERFALHVLTELYRHRVGPIN